MRHISAAALTFAATVLLFLPAQAGAKTALVELRVEGPGATLDPGTWYVTGPERVRKSKPSDACNRAKGRVAVPGPTPLSLAQAGAGTNGDLRQVRVRRDEAGLFMCEIGSVLGRPFTHPDGFAGWSYYEDYVFGSAAADQLKLSNRDSVLWVFSDFGATTPANTGPALELRRVPARTKGTFTVRVVEHIFDGSTNPAAGATIEGADSVNELGGGRYEVTVGSGNSTLRATRALDIASNQVETCSRAKLAGCPRAHGKTIVGSDRADKLKGTRGFDDIESGAGRDVIDLRKGGRDRADCGAGKDLVLIQRGDRDDRIAGNCERKRRSWGLVREALRPTLRRWAPAALAAALAGCGLGPGPSTEGTATLTVTRDYGTSPVIEASVDDPDESETVLRMLDREAEIETRYGGGFVQAIEGVAGATDGDRRLDWFFYVNGIESPIGSAERPVAGGDRVWWDHHDWTDAMRVPAVVGSWPEPFLQFSADEERLPVRVECAGEREPCRTAGERLMDEGVSVSQEPYEPEAGEEALRVLVGMWSEIRRDPAAGQIGAGPATSGVFARFEGTPATELLALDERTETASRLGRGAGLVAAVRDGEDPPTWVVSGVDAGGVQAAAEALDAEVLRDRYAVVVAAGSDETLPVPVVGSG